MTDQWEQRNGIRSRRYEAYEEYLQHQASKLKTLDLSKYHKKFRESLIERLSGFEDVAEISTVLCLAARSGSEVEAFKLLGKFSVGIDLMPTEKSRYVLHGDFHALQFASDSCDCIYTNSMDHAFALRKMLAEVFRVLKPGGLFIAEIVHGSDDDDGREPGEYEAQWWSSYRDVTKLISAADFAPVAEKPFSYPWRGTTTLWRKPIA